MLRLKHETLVWSDADTVAMARVLGSDMAVKGRAPYLDSILKAAAAERVMLSERARDELANAIEYRRWLKPLKLIPDKVKPRHGLFAHQAVDLEYMRRTKLPGYLLASQPGVGKTLVAMMHMRKQAEAERILVITPNSGKSQWRREIRRWLGRKDLPVTIVQGTMAEQIQQASVKRGWIIGHWESLVHARLGYRQEPFDGIILDEAHNIASREAQRTETALLLEATHRLALTAHPYTNSLAEMFPILQFLYPNVYTSFWRWAYLHIDMIPKAFGGFDMTGAVRPKLLKWELAPFTIRRTKRQVFKSLPRITRIRREAELSERGLREYARIKKQFFAELDADAGRAGDTFHLPIINAMARTTRMRQYLVDPGLLGAREKSAKYPIVLELLRELDRPPVIFTSFRQAAVRLEAFLKKQKLSCGFIHGGMAERVGREQRRFLKGKYDALLVVTQAGSTVLNLGGYGYVIHLDLPWHPRDLEQSEGRVDRPEEGTGKLIPTTAYRIIVPGTYEEKMEKKLERKHAQFGEVFTVGQLKELFA